MFNFPFKYEKLDLSSHPLKSKIVVKNCSKSVESRLKHKQTHKQKSIVKFLWGLRVLLTDWWASPGSELTGR